MPRSLLVLALSLSFLPVALAEDWPQFRGPQRDNVWRESGILQHFPAEGLKIRWRTPVGGGHSSPIVVQGRVYVTDMEVTKPSAWERIHCFDEKTGKPIWTHRDKVPFSQSYDPENPTGPCSTPTIEDGRLYNLGSTGQLSCLETGEGRVLWKKNLKEDYQLIDPPNLTACPLIEDDLLIVLIGGKPGACVVAFDKHTGEEVWRALDDPPRAYSSPIVINSGAKRQLIVWTPSAVTSLNPATGKTWWREKLITREDNAGAAPVFQNGFLLISGLMFQLDPDKPGARAIWPEKKTQAMRILSNTCMPLIQGEEVYAANMHGKLICLDRLSGKQLWETDGITGREKYGAIHLAPNGDSVLLYTDEGNLIRARLDRGGYHELGRAHLVDPTFLVRGRKLVWAPPAFANRHVFVRNSRELICASLAAKP